jgi:hypothetical protein
VLTVRVLGGSNLLWRTPPLSDELIRCQSDHDDYACPRGGVAMSGGDGTDFSNRVTAASHAWAPVVASCLVWH